MAFFIGQTYPQIILDVQIDVSGATEYRVLYKKPQSGQRGFWPAILDPTNNNRIVLDQGVFNFDEEGEWEIQAYFVINGNRGFGQIAKLDVVDPLNHAGS